MFMSRKLTDQNEEVEWEPDEQSIDVVDIDQLTNKDWIDIKKIAIQIHGSGKMGPDQLKCAVAAFCMWLEFKADQDEEDQDPGLH